MVFKNPNYEDLRDYLFIELISLMYEDYLRIKKETKKGVEDHKLTGSLIIYHNTPLKKYYDVSKKLNLFKKPVSLFNHNLNTFKEALERDGAIIIEAGKIVANGVFIDGTINYCKRGYGVESFDRLAKRFLPKRPRVIGNRTRVGLSISLTGNKNGACYTMSQTVHTNAGTGRILVCGKKGVKRSFHLVVRGGKVFGVLSKYEYDKKDKEIKLVEKELIKEKEIKKIRNKLKKFKLKPRKNTIFDIFPYLGRLILQQ